MASDKSTFPIGTLIAPEVLHDWGEMLLVRLCQVSSSALYHEFDAVRPVGQGLLAALFSGSLVNPTRFAYEAFVATTRDAQFQNIFSKYPVLARLITCLLDDWEVNVLTWIDRLAVDWNLIQHHFCSGSERTGPAVRVEGPLSDPHAGGQAAVKVFFRSGLQLAYKPRGLGLDEAFAGLLTWCNGRGLPYDLKIPRAVDCGSHGWCEWVDQAPCNSRAEVSAYFTRAGQLLGLLYVLGGTDFHYENVIAAGAHPVPVDLETIFTPMSGVPAPHEKSIVGFADSVARVGMLAQWDWWVGSDVALDLSALGGGGSQFTAYPVATWRNMNTDDMTQEFSTQELPKRSNGVFLHGKLQSVKDHVDDLASGCAAMLDMLRQARGEISSENGPLHHFAGKPVRFLVRHTQQYGTVMRHALEPRYLHDGRDFSIEIDALARGVLALKPLEMEAGWQVLNEELDALLNLDIPYLQTRTDARCLLNERGAMLAHDWFGPSGMDLVRGRLERLTPQAIAWQTQVIRRSVAVWQSGSVRHRVEAPAMTASQDTVSIVASGALPKLTREEHVDRLVARLLDEATPQSDNSVSWLRATPLGPTGRVRLREGDLGFYSGAAGIALTLAAHDRIHRRKRNRAIVHRALLPLTSLIQDSSVDALSAFVHEVGLGLAEGVGGLLLTYGQLAQWWSDNALLASALKLTQACTTSLINDVSHLDVISGLAGFLLGLDQLARGTQSALVRDAMLCAATRLAKLTEERCSAQPSGDMGGGTPFLTGFSHGASGAAFSLLAAYRHHPTPAIFRAVESAAAYERRHFMIWRNNWADLRRSPEEVHGVGAMSWCHGAPGIALARLRMVDWCVPEAETELVQAIATTCANLRYASDHLCCGYFGVLQILAHAAHVRNDCHLLKLVQDSADERLAVGSPWHVFPVDVSDYGNPGFMDGYAGIAYALMHLSHPTLLPNVVAFG